MEIRKDIEFDFSSWEKEIDITQLKKDLTKLQEIGATKIIIESGINFDCSFICIEAFTYRRETLAELKEKKARKEQSDKIIKDLELKEYKRLNKIYGNKRKSNKSN